MNHYPFEKIARLAAPNDNAAVATQNIAANTTIMFEGASLNIKHNILEGHRFAIKAIEKGSPILSWDMPFAKAITEIAAGDYLCNDDILHSLKQRSKDLDLPEEGNFENEVLPVDIETLVIHDYDKPIPQMSEQFFMGYNRDGNRGVGTRNMIVIVGLSSRVAGYVKRLEKMTQSTADGWDNVDGIVAVAHTEGAAKDSNNTELLLRTLSGFLVHPNVAAALIVDDGLGSIDSRMLQSYMREHDYPILALEHQFLQLSGSFETMLERGTVIVEGWLEQCNKHERSKQPLSKLKIALQCGGSDAFSGISGNPLAAWAAKEVVAQGGSANIAETDELIGAERYMLAKVKDKPTAERFLMMVERFKERVAWHGTSAEGNPSGGNKFRGLYNIVLKSIGAAMKKHPDVSLDEVIDYGQPMKNSGFYFMDSPGNDLESIAGQVASGCNLIYFVTGNGSITNFPFVPTVKIVTTTERYTLLENDMDINAGEYLDGTPLDNLGKNLVDYSLAVVSGKHSVGELAGHAQVQIWRNWQQSDASNLKSLQQRPKLSGQPIAIDTTLSSTHKKLLKQTEAMLIATEDGYATEQIGLILPTSLCSGQIASMIANTLNEEGLGKMQGISRYVTLAHTEGCGASSGRSEEIYVETLLGYLEHPMVKFAYLLEHGCEKTHNDFMRGALDKKSLSQQPYGWGSIQLDGGITKAKSNLENWFKAQLENVSNPTIERQGLGALRIGLMSVEDLSDDSLEALTVLTKMIIKAGGTVVTPEEGTLATAQQYQTELSLNHASASLDYAATAQDTGFYIMACPTSNLDECVSGLGATGVDIILLHTHEQAVQGHPMIPVFQLSHFDSPAGKSNSDIDLVLSNHLDDNIETLVKLIKNAASREIRPQMMRHGNVNFQITRGELGVSL